MQTAAATLLVLAVVGMQPSTVEAGPVSKGATWGAVGGAVVSGITGGKPLKGAAAGAAAGAAIGLIKKK